MLPSHECQTRNLIKLYGCKILMTYFDEGESKPFSVWYSLTNASFFNCSWFISITIDVCWLFKVEDDSISSSAELPCLNKYVQSVNTEVFTTNFDEEETKRFSVWNSLTNSSFFNCGCFISTTIDDCCLLFKGEDDSISSSAELPCLNILNYSY